MNYDLIIIGAGPGGYYAAQLALKEKKKVLLIEKHKVGGVCLNYGCIPSKSLLFNAKMYHRNLNLENLAYSLNNLHYDQNKAVNIKDNKVFQLVSALENKLKKSGCEILFGKATILNKKNAKFQVRVADEIYTSEYLIIATGSNSFIPNISGSQQYLTNENFITSKEALSLKTLPSKLVIIGGGVIALEMASYFIQVNCEVTILDVGNDILGPIDEEIRTKLRNHFHKNYHIKIITNVKNMNLNSRSVEYTHNNQNYNLEFDKILFATGRKANVNDLGLENLNVDFSQKGIVVNDKMETNIVNLYAIGDVKGFMMLAHSAYREAEVVIDQIMKKTTTMNYNSIPAVVFTNPEIATVGLTQKQADEQNLKYYIKKSSLLVSGKFFIENTNFDGLIKFVIEKNSNKILGVHIIGDNAGEVIGVCSLIVNKKMTLEMLNSLVLPHPSLGEILKNLVMLS